jgi:hypothetical protein
VTGVQRPRCPFLAVYEDPQTAFGYPNPANNCHAGGRPNPVLLDHQDRICLSAVYPQCPVYKQPGKLRPPSGLPKKGAPFWRAPFWRTPRFWIGAAVLLAVLILAFFLAVAWILL